MTMKQSKGLTSSISWSFSTKINFGGGVVIDVVVGIDFDIGVGPEQTKATQRRK
jgi:hypothetical protein